MRILVTGAKGQVGQALCQQLAQAELLALDHQQLDICQFEQVRQQVAAFQPDIIINAAAYTAVDLAESQPELCNQINVQGAENLAKAAAQIGAAFLHISTDYVFDGNKTSPYQEQDLCQPLNHYGNSKLQGELAVLNANPRSIILRTSWVFSEHGKNFVKTMLRLGKERESLSIVADQIGGPTYAPDIAQALIQIAHQIMQGKQAWGIYHFAGKPDVSWFEFAQAIFQQAEKFQKKTPHLLPISSAEYPTPAKRPANSCLNLEKIQRTFAIQPSDWRKALENIQGYLE